MNKAAIQNMTSVIWGRYSKAAKIRSSLYQNTSAQLKSYLLNFTLCKPINIPVHNSINIYYIYTHLRTSDVDGSLLAEVLNSG